MENLFFNSAFVNFEQSFTKLLIICAISALLLFALFFILSKLLYKRSRQRREILLRLTFLWSIFIFFIVFNVYIFMLFYSIGIDNMDFTNGRFYLGIISQIILFIVIPIFFFVKRHTLKKIIIENSLN